MSHDSHDSHDSEPISLTLYWLSRESEPHTFSWNPLHGWYRLKQHLLERLPPLPVRNPLQISLFRLQEDDLVECRSGAMESGVYYATVRPSLRERLDYIYPMEDANLWRWTYVIQENRMTLSFLEHNGRFCRLQEFYQAKQAGHPIPWHPSVDAFLSWVTETGGIPMEGTLRSHLLLLWHQRRW